MYNVKFFSSSAIPFETVIDVATTTATTDNRTLLSFTLIGLYVGVIPVFLGMFWLPALRRLGPQAMMFLMALTAGLLLFLGIDATSEALEQAREIGTPFQGIGLAGLGVVVTFLLLDAISRRQSTIGRKASDKRLAVAFMISIGIGLHNLGEGLAIGASFSVGAAALGTFLVVGFILQNITEGLGIIAPLRVINRRSPICSRWGSLVVRPPLSARGSVGSAIHSHYRYSFWRSVQALSLRASPQACCCSM